MKYVAGTVTAVSRQSDTELSQEEQTELTATLKELAEKYSVALVVVGAFSRDAELPNADVFVRGRNRRSRVTA